MSLYISRLALNPLFGPAIKLAASPEELHAKLYALVPTPGHGTSRSLLFRVDVSDNGPVVLLQSSAEPDWAALEVAPRTLLEPPATKEFDPTFRLGQRMGFRLLARPSTRKSGDYGLKKSGKRQPGPRVDCRDDEQRLEWLRRKSGQHGFQVEAVGLTMVSMPAVKSDRAPREKGGSFTAVQFDGVLVVTDPEKLREAVCNGIGPQKAYGFGLLSLAPMRD